MSAGARACSAAAFALVVSGAVAPAIARADEPARARLAYVHDPSLASCPTDKELRDSVAARIGYDPFASAKEDEPIQILVQVRRQKSAVAGTLEILGPHPGKKELDSPRGDCREVVDAFAVAIALAIDPASATRPPPAPAPPPEPAPAPAPPPEPAPEPVPDRVSAPDTDRVIVSAGASARLLANELPSVAAGGAVHVAARYEAFEPRIEGIFTSSGSTPRNGLPGSVSASLIAASILPCAHVAIAYGCGGVTLGAMRAEGEGIGSPKRESDLYATFTIRAGVAIPLSRVIDLDASADVAIPLTRFSLAIDGSDVFRSPSAGFRLALGPSFRFP